MSVPLFVRCCLLGAAAFLTSALAPPSVARSEILTLEKAIARAAAENPALRGGEYLLQGSRARAERAAQRPALTAGVELEDFAGTGELSGIDALQSTLRLGSVIELGGRRSARMAVADVETDVATIEQEARRLDLLSQVATRFIAVAARQESLAVTRESTRLAQATVDRVGERIHIGAAPQHELSRAQIRLARARIEEEHAEHDLASARVQLAATWGATDPQFDGVSAGIFELPETKSLQALSAQIDATPEIRLLMSRERLADAHLTLARSARGPELSWSAGVRHLQSIDDTAFVASVAVPLGVRRRAEPGLKEAQALSAKAPLDVQAARVDIHATLFELYQEMSHARLEAQTLRDQVQPQAESVLRFTERAFQQGGTTFLEFANAQEQLLDVRRDAVTAAAEYHALVVEIERLTGTSLGAEQATLGEEP